MMDFLKVYLAALTFFFLRSVCTMLGTIPNTAGTMA